MTIPGSLHWWVGMAIDTVLIPSARVVAPEMQRLFGAIPPALIPVDGQVMLDHLAARYGDMARIVVLVHEQADAVRAHIAAHPALHHVTVHDVGPTHSLGETVLAGLMGLGDALHGVVVNFADTLILSGELDGNAVWFQNCNDLERWTTFNLDGAGRFVDVQDKAAAAGGYQARPVFSGVFALQDGAAFRQRLALAVERDNAGMDPFYAAFTAHFNALGLQDKKFIHADSWLDLGHADGYVTARTVILNACRAFNALSIDPARCLVTKTSQNTDKFRDEIAWYGDLPQRLAWLAPRVVRDGRQDTPPSVTLEYYHYPNLARVWLADAWDVPAWQRMLDTLAFTLAEMRAEKADLPLSRRQQACRMMYCDKTRERLADLAGREPFATLLGSGVTVNGQAIPSLDRLERLVDGLQIPEFTVIHGDFCLSNILASPDQASCRLIDPRGRFGDVPLHGDPLYDVAKLSHSIHGDYDLILNGLFAVDQSGQDWTLDVWHSPRQREVRSLFADWLARSHPGQEQEVRLREALLFLSMVPLHPDRPFAQVAFLLRGLELLGHYAAQQPAQELGHCA